MSQYVRWPQAGSSGGSGNVVGPVSSTVGDIATFGNTSGTLLQDNPLATIDSSGNITAQTFFAVNAYEGTSSAGFAIGTAQPYEQLNIGNLADDGQMTIVNGEYSFIGIGAAASMANNLQLGSPVTTVTIPGPIQAQSGLDLGGSDITSVNSITLSVPLAISSGGTGLSSTSAHFALIGPTSGSGAPSFRALVAGDVPSLPYQPTGNYITALTGDGTASGPGSVPLTLATVNSNVGTFTNATLTVNGKGLVTAASNGAAPVTSISVASSNGFAGSSSGGATPTLTLSTSITGLLKGNGTAISAAGSADLPTITLTGNVTGAASGGSIATTIAAGVITNSMVNASAAIAYSKLSLTGSIVNADIATAAAIVPSKLSAVGARYTNTSTAAVPTSATVFNFSTSDYDTSSIVTTGASWKATVPSGMGGKWRIEAGANCNSALVNAFTIEIFKNGTTSTSSLSFPQEAAGSFNSGLYIADTLNLVATDLIQIRISSVFAATFVSPQWVTFIYQGA